MRLTLGAGHLAVTQQNDDFLPHPQVISTDRHILQGWVDLADVRWDAEAKTLSGVAHVIGGEPCRIVIANNGAKLHKTEANEGGIEWKYRPSDDLVVLTLTSSANNDVRWKLKYE